MAVVVGDGSDGVLGTECSLELMPTILASRLSLSTTTVRLDFANSNAFRYGKESQKCPKVLIVYF